MERLLLNGRLANGFCASVLIQDGIIAAIDPADIPSHCKTMDFGDNYILPGFIEVHAHGGGGFDFVDVSDESFDGVFSAHLAHGVTSLCPTLCSSDFELTLDFLRLCEKKSMHPGFIGVHLEGPFLSPEMCGAQNLSCICEPTEDKIQALLPFAKLICRITVAPEVSCVDKLAAKMLPLGVKLSAGHTAACAKDFYSAKKLGVTSVTHLYSSMKGRYKDGSFVLGGLVEAALADDECYVELIGDGHHVSCENLLLTLKCKGKDRVVLVSDAMRAADQYSPFESNYGESFLGAKRPENRVIIEGGVAKLPDRSSFAGSIAIGDTMVKALVEGYGLALDTVSYIMSTSPAGMLGLRDRGRLAAGLRADITVLDKNYNTVAVLCEGKTVFSKES